MILSQKEILQYYSRKDVQRGLVSAAKDREVGVRFGENGFGKRPDVLQFEGDVLDLAKMGATSFHLSEEHWRDPLAVKTGMSKKELDELRMGFDIIIDIDCKFLEYSKITAGLILEILKFHGLENIGLKFSGNRSFHIGIPFKAFPTKVNNFQTKNLFPESARIIAAYIKERIKDQLSAQILGLNSISEIAKSTGKEEKDLREKKCIRCKILVTTKTFIHLKCKDCKRIDTFTNIIDKPLICSGCYSPSVELQKEFLDECSECRNRESFSFGEFNPYSIIEIDTILISSRHLYRSPYSLNEKSGLVSIPIKTSELKNFKLNSAKLQNIVPETKFLNESDAKEDEAKELIIQAFDWYAKNTKKEEKTITVPFQNNKSNIPVKEDYFPPCIKILKNGVQKDGRKRALFILINFLFNMNWDLKKIDEFIMEWNSKNYEPLREGYIKAQINWYNRQQQKNMPPNCINESYYKDIGICQPDNFCKFIKNPVNYSLRKLRLQNRKSS